MAVGLPTKVTYANGDVFSASDINDTNGTINLIGQTNNFYAGKNKIINSDFRFNSRAFSSITSTGYGFDRWRFGVAGDGTSTNSTQAFTLGTAPVTGYEGTNFARIVTTGQTQTASQTQLQQRIESVRTFANQTVTISFWAKAASATPKIAIELVQNFGTGGSPSANVNNYVGQVTLSTSWARYSASFAVPSISGKTIGTDSNSDYLQLGLWVSGGSDFNSRTGSLGIQSNTFDIWGVQVEPGSTATAFQTATGTIQGELAACQRYYVRYGGSEVYEMVSELGMAYATTNCANEVSVATMRVRPTSVSYSNLELVIPNSATYAISAVTLSGSESGKNKVLVTTTTTGLTVNRTYFIRCSNSLNGYLAFDAEL
jgi:hypothetical protein